MGQASAPEHPSPWRSTSVAPAQASVLDKSGAMVANRLKVATTYPCRPEDGRDVTKLVAALPRPTGGCGLPGHAPQGHISRRPNSTQSMTGLQNRPKLVAAWTTSTCGRARRLDRQAHRVANDAMSRASRSWRHGPRAGGDPRHRFARPPSWRQAPPAPRDRHQPFRKGETYDQQIGEGPRKEIATSAGTTGCESHPRHEGTLLLRPRLHRRWQCPPPQPRQLG